MMFTLEEIQREGKARVGQRLIGTSQHREDFPDRFYAAYDESTGAVIGWYDTWDMGNPYSLNDHPYVPCTPEVWDSRTLNGHSVIGGKLINTPVKIVEPTIQEKAQELLNDTTNLLWGKYGARGRTPPEIWGDYLDALDSVIEGKTDSLPDYPGM